MDVVRMKDLDAIRAERSSADRGARRDDRCGRRDAAPRDNERREEKDERPLS